MNIVIIESVPFRYTHGKNQVEDVQCGQADEATLVLEMADQVMPCIIERHEPGKIVATVDAADVVFVVKENETGFSTAGMGFETLLDVVVAGLIPQLSVYREQLDLFNLQQLVHKI